MIFRFYVICLKVIETCRGTAIDMGFVDKYQLTLQVVLRRCQDKPACQVAASGRVFGEDLCPGTTKYLEVSYKCRPSKSTVLAIECKNCLICLYETAKTLSVYQLV